LSFDNSLNVNTSIGLEGLPRIDEMNGLYQNLFKKASSGW